MNIAIIGASGFVGKFVLEEAISRGHKVTAIVRNPEKLTAQENLNIVKADVTNEDKLAELLKDQDAVVSAYNPGHTLENLYNLHVNGFKSILQAVKKSGIKRFIVVGGAGSLEVAPGLQLVDTPEFPEIYKATALAARESLNILKSETELEWTFFAPAAIIAPGERTGKFRVGKNQLISNENGESKISNQDYAVALIDEIENPANIREIFTAAY